MKKQYIAAMAAASVAFGTISFAHADAQAAKDYVKQAKDLVDSHDTDGANAKLELAETELDGVDAGTKKPISDSIAELKKTIASANAAGDADKYHRKIGLLMDDAESAVGNQVTWSGAASALKELFDDPAAQAAIPDEIAAAKKKFATFDKLNAKKTAVVVAAQVDDSMKQLDSKWAESKPKFTDPNANPGDKSSAIDDMTRAMDETRQQIAHLPADSDEAKGYTAHVDRIGAEFAQIALADKAKEVLARLKDSFGSYKDEYDGWEKEPADGPSWADYQHHQSDTMSALNAPKSQGLITRSDSFLKDLATNDDYKSVAAAPDVKAFIEEVKANRHKVYSLMVQRATSITNQAVATGGDALSSLKDSVRLTLGEDSPEGKSLQDAIQKKIDGGTAAAAGNDAAQAEWYKKSSETAAAAWPDIAAKFEVSEGFDPNAPADFKGKTIKITTSNLMGYRFQPGDFEFATTLSGMPIAARFDPTLKAAVAAIEKKLGRSLGDNDDDGKWEVLAVVTGSKGRMMQKKQAEGDVKVDGETVGKVASDYADPVDAPIVTIVAGKCGPFVGGKGAGLMQPNGTVAK